MRIVLTLILLFAVGAMPSPAAETVGEWLNRSANAKAGLREREFAARQVIMLADESASILISALKGEGSDSGLRRQVAARILGEIGKRDFEAPLLEAAFGEDYFLAEAAKIALARLYSRLSDGEIYTLLTKTTRERNGIPGGAPSGTEDWLVLSIRRAEGQGRFQALVMRGLALKYKGTGKTLPEPLIWRVWEALRDPDRELRRAAVQVVPNVGNSDATEKLAVFLYTENDPLLLREALRAMSEMRPPDYGDAVERHVRHDDPMVSLEAMAALAAMGYQGMLFPAGQGSRAVAAFVSHPSTPVRRRAIEILAESKNPAALEYLTAALYDRVGVNRATAARALGDLGFTGAIGGLSPLLRDGRPEARAEAAVALSRLGVVGVASGVIDDLRKESLPFRIAAAEALGRIGDARAVPALLEAVSDPDIELACTAAEAVRRLGDAGAVVRLSSILEETVDPVLAEAIQRAVAELRTEGLGDGLRETDAPIQADDAP